MTDFLNLLSVTLSACMLLLTPIGYADVEEDPVYKPEVFAEQKGFFPTIFYYQL